MARTPGKGGADVRNEGRAGTAVPRLARRFWLPAPRRHQMRTLKIDSQAHLIGYLPGAVVDRKDLETQGE